MRIDPHHDVTRGIPGGRDDGALVADAQLAALALEHAVPIVSTDADFDRFPGLTRIDPRR